MYIYVQLYNRQKAKLYLAQFSKELNKSVFKNKKIVYFVMMTRVITKGKTFSLNPFYIVTARLCRSIHFGTQRNTFTLCSICTYRRWNTKQNPKNVLYNTVLNSRVFLFFCTFKEYMCEKVQFSKIRENGSDRAQWYNVLLATYILYKFIFYTLKFKAFIFLYILYTYSAIYL